jgi:hypothetical protein
MSKRKAEGIDHTPHELEIIAKADRYVAYLFVGRGHKHKIDCATEAEARSVGQVLATQHQKGALIYAVADAATALLDIIRPDANGAARPRADGHHQID